MAYWFWFKPHTNRFEKGGIQGECFFDKILIFFYKIFHKLKRITIAKCFLKTVAYKYNKKKSLYISQDPLFLCPSIDTLIFNKLICQVDKRNLEGLQ